MIFVTVFQNNRQEYVGFATNGHACYAEEGMDIVCAAVSVLVINTINAIEQFDKDSFAEPITDQASGTIRFEVAAVTEYNQLLLKSMILGLESLLKDNHYREFIELHYKEV